MQNAEQHFPENGVDSVTYFVEKGASSLVTRTQYEMGIRIGVFVPTFARPIFARTQDRDMAILFKEKLKEKFVEYLAEKAIKDADSRKLVGLMFLNEQIGKHPSNDNNDWLSKLLSKMGNEFQAQ